jgi:hypothetical protein
MPHGRTSVGAPERKESSKLVLLLSACASPTDHRRGSGTRVSNICQGVRLGSSEKYYLANLPAKSDLRTLAATIKARWICEQAHQQMKEELGLDHFEGRSWQGLHRHALMTMIAYAFLQHRCLADTSRKKKNQWAPPQPNCPPYVTPSSDSSLKHHRSDARIVENGFAASSGVSNSAKVVRGRVLMTPKSKVRFRGANPETLRPLRIIRCFLDLQDLQAGEIKW